ncbi:ArnT family glycosyltransferase [Streptomyces sp. NPDC002577]
MPQSLVTRPEFAAKRPPSRMSRAICWWESHARVIAMVAVGLSVMLAGSYALVLGDTIRFPDEQEYVTLTQNLADGRGFSYQSIPSAFRPVGVAEGQATAYRPPGIVFLYLPVYLAGGGVVALRLVGVLALAASVWLAFLLGRRLGSAGTGALAAVGVAGYPLFLFTATTLYPQIPALALLLLVLEATLRIADRPPRLGRWILAAGVAGGLLILTVPTFAPAIPLILGWVAWTKRRQANRAVVRRALTAALAVTILVVGAWTVRNAIELKRFVPVATNGGFNLLLGNYEGVTAATGTRADVSQIYADAENAGLTEAEADGYFADRALAWIRANPGEEALLYLNKVAYTFAYSNDLATSGQQSVLRDLVSALSFYPVLLLVAARVLLSRRRALTPTEKLMLGMVVTGILLFAVFFVRIRFRLPMDGIMIILAAAGAMHLLTLRRPDLDS